MHTTPNWIITVGLVDDIKSMDGCLEVFDLSTGKSLVFYTESCRLCSIATIRKDDDKNVGNDAEYLFVGTSEKKVIEYLFKGEKIIKMKEFETCHKKSIFGIAALD